MLACLCMHLVLSSHHTAWAAQAYEAAGPCFEAAALFQPHEPKWPLMAAGCLRRCSAAQQVCAWSLFACIRDILFRSHASTALRQALARYKAVLEAHPHNQDCLRALIEMAVEAGALGMWWPLCMCEARAQPAWAAHAGGQPQEYAAQLARAQDKHVRPS